MPITKVEMILYGMAAVCFVFLAVLILVTKKRRAEWRLRDDMEAGDDGGWPAMRKKAGGNGNPRRSPLLRSWSNAEKPRYEVPED